MLMSMAASAVSGFESEPSALMDGLCDFFCQAYVVSMMCTCVLVLRILRRVAGIRRAWVYT